MIDDAADGSADGSGDHTTDGMIDGVVGALDARTWPEYVHGQLGPRIGSAIRPALRPVVGAVVAEPGSVQLGGSKLGGLPHVDGAFDWPTEDGTDEPLALVCQLNLAEAGVSAGAEDGDGLVAATGMLHLFSIFDSDRAYGYEIDDLTTRLIHVPQPGPLAIAERPAGLPDDGVLAERGLHLAPSLIAESDPPGAHERYDYEVERALDEELLARGGAPSDVVRLLGHPHPFREETRELIDDGDRLLLYVNGYATDRHAFGEGEFRVVIGRHELAAGRLDQARVLFEPGT